MLANEIAHQLDAFGVLHHFDLPAVGPQCLFGTLKRDVLANDDARNFVEHYRAAAHRAGGQRRVDRAARVNRSVLPTGVFQAVHFGVMNHAAALHPLVTSAAHDLAVADQHRADRNAAFAPAEAGFIDGSLEELVDARSLRWSLADALELSQL